VILNKHLEIQEKEFPIKCHQQNTQFTIS